MSSPARSRMTAPAALRLHPLARASLSFLAATAIASAADAQTTSDAPADTPAPAQQRIEVIGVSPLPGVQVPRDRIPAQVQSARAADIERSGALDLSSFMNRRLGSVFVNESQNNPFQPDINFRGFTASPLLGTQQGLSVYVDGVRMNQPFGDVVSWDLIPKSAIASMTLNPGSNPLYGMNTLGGALVVVTKDGRTSPGSSVQLLGGSHRRIALEFEHGGRDDVSGLEWFLTGNRFHEKGWRPDSPSDLTQLFGKLGWRDARTRISLSASVADTDLNGNGMQEMRLMQRDHASVYTKPDNTSNRGVALNLQASRELSSQWTLAGNVYARSIRTKTYNGDLNDDSLDQSLYQPNAAERAILAANGYTGFPASLANASNTPFPKWRCIAQALLVDEPAEKCNGVINQTRTQQSQFGLNLQLSHQGEWLQMPATSLLGVAADFSRSHFTQGSELGYLNPDRSITGVGAFGDGVTGGEVDGQPYDTRVDLRGRNRTLSAFASTILTVAPDTFLTLSGRYNHVTVRNRDAIHPGGGPGSLDGNHTFRRLNPALGLTFQPARGLNAWVGVNQGSRAPSSIELGCADPANPCKLPNSFAGDPPLQQVVTTTIEAGIRSASGSAVAWSAGIFRSDNRDDLLFVADSPSGFGYFRNFGKTRRQGIELAASTKLFDDVTVGANLTFLDATFRSPEIVNGAASSASDQALAGFPGTGGTIEIRPGDRIPLVPRRMAKLYADWDIDSRFSVGGDVAAVSGSIARGNENGQHQPDGLHYLGPGRSPGYAVLNLNAAYRPTAHLKLFVQFSNVLGRKYSTAAQLGATGLDANGNFQARPFAANANGDYPLQSSTFYAPGAPRAVQVGVKATF